ncbi:MAG: hypothetical protein M2R45_03302 [Verrucomicrobia subdivision 3 bacterium]|nr:hypothetical protein [Limisphaerales bacterium]MCS1415420.1 hypothetical protein [Limisphaerales bacterium]
MALSDRRAFSRSEKLAFLALIGGATAIGVAPIWIRISELGPSATAFYRLLFALPFFWFWVWWDGEGGSQSQLRPTIRQVGHLFGAGSFFALDMAFWGWSIHRTTIANATLLANAAPVFVALGAWLWFREAITRVFVGGLVGAMFGAAILTGASFAEASSHLSGDVFALLAAVFYGGYMLYVKWLRRTFDPVVIMAWSGIASTLGLGLIAWISGESLVVETGRGIAIIVALALVAQVAGQTLIAYAFKHLPASFSAVGLLWQPAVAAFLGWLLLHEEMTLIQLGGGLLMLGGIYACGKGSR